MLERIRNLSLLRVATIYVVGGWIVIQFAQIAFEAFEVPNFVLQWVMAIVFSGFPLVILALSMMGVPFRRSAAEEVEERDESREESAQPQQPVDPGDLPARDNRPSIALLPFRYLGEGEAFLAEGLRMGLQTNMVRLSGLFQVYSLLNEAYVSGEVDGEVRGRDANAQYVLEATVHELTGRVRISLQLTEVATGSCAWAEQYDRDLEDLFELQDEIMKEVIASLHIRLRNAGIEDSWFDQLRSAVAKEWYFRGANHLAGMSRETNAAAREAFEKLHELEPESAIGSSNVALTYWNDFAAGWGPDRDQALAHAIEWAKLARSYDRNDGIGDAVYAYEQLGRRNYEGAMEAARRSVRVRPNCPISLGVLAQVENCSGNHDAAAALAEIAQSKVEVPFPWVCNVLATAQRDGGQLERSLLTLERALQAAPDDVDLLVTKCSDHALLSDLESAESAASRILSVEPEWSTAQYAAEALYRSPDELDRVVAALRSAGLP